jgi:hypothetical protein
LPWLGHSGFGAGADPPLLAGATDDPPPPTSRIAIAADAIAITTTTSTGNDGPAQVNSRGVRDLSIRAPRRPLSLRQRTARNVQEMCTHGQTLL